VKRSSKLSKIERVEEKYLKWVRENSEGVYYFKCPDSYAFVIYTWRSKTQTTVTYGAEMVNSYQKPSIRLQMIPKENKFGSLMISERYSSLKPDNVKLELTAFEDYCEAAMNGKPMKKMEYVEERAFLRKVGFKRNYYQLPLI